MILATAFVVLVVTGVGIYKYRSRSVLPANGRVPLYVAEFTNTRTAGSAGRGGINLPEECGFRSFSLHFYNNHVTIC